MEEGSLGVEIRNSPQLGGGINALEEKGEEVTPTLLRGSLQS